MIKNILRKVRLLSKTRKEPYLLFHKVLGFYPDKIEYYQLAVRHKSVSILTENGNHLSNERLEFLGDAVLNSVVTDILYHRYENQREGFLTNTRSKIVKRDSLNQLAVEIGLDKLVKVTKYVNTHTNNNIYGNALEAIMGAIYLDYGYKKCKKFVEQRLIRTFVNLDKVAENEVNFKSKLIEWCQKNRLESEFVLVQETLSQANKHIFQSQLTIQGKTICEATGASKKESQQNASRIALELIQSNPEFLQEISKSDEKEQELIEAEENQTPDIFV
ncbi:MAG: ribonuclease III [Paludibacter sp.]|nr:ribonuclease III [Paludibacter sp.]